MAATMWEFSRLDQLIITSRDEKRTKNADDHIISSQKKPRYRLCSFMETYFAKTSQKPASILIKLA